jgi:hypothetical protein
MMFWWSPSWVVVLTTATIAAENSDVFPMSFVAVAMLSVPAAMAGTS